MIDTARPPSIPGNGQLLAAVDLGSNSFHMVVGQLAAGQVTVVHRMKELVQLGAGLDQSRMLSLAAQERALSCLERFGERTRTLPARNVRVVGTNTLRVARNTDAFLVRAERALGHGIQVINGIEEARLIYAGVSRDLPEGDQRRLVADIGGGSTELVIGKGAEPLDLESLYMGSISMMQRHFPEGRIDAARFRRAEVTALQELERVQVRFRKLGWDVAIGASGTVRAVARVLTANGFGEEGLTARGVRKLREAVIAAGSTAKLALEGLSPSRAAVFPGGLAIVSAIMESLEVSSMQVSHSALREGLLDELRGRFLHEDVRNATVAAMLARYGADEAQAQRVEVTALSLLAQVAGAWGLPLDRSREVLSWSARLHEIGLDIAHSHYHKHGAYVVEHGDMPGFSQKEQRLLAALVRAHRRKFPRKVLDALGPDARLATHLAILLRLAALLHRSRSDVLAVTLAPDHNALAVSFAPGWLDAHPLMLADLAEEAELLRAAGFNLKIPGQDPGTSAARR